jgi:hypothetical protein
MLDFYDFLDDVWLCHSEGGICYNHTAFQPASQTLKEIELFLVANPTEIIIIFIEDYVQVPNGGGMEVCSQVHAQIEGNLGP